MPIAIDRLLDSCGVPRRRRSCSGLPQRSERRRIAPFLTAEPLEARRVLAASVTLAGGVLTVAFDDAAHDSVSLSITPTGYVATGDVSSSGTGPVAQLVVTDLGTVKTSSFTLLQAGQPLTSGLSIDANVTAASIDTSVNTNGGAILLAAPTTLAAITLDSGSGDQTFSGPVTLAGDVTLAAAGGGDLTFQGGVTTQAGQIAGLTVSAGRVVAFSNTASEITGSISVTARNVSVEADLVSKSGDITLIGDTGITVAGTFNGVYVNGSGVEVKTLATDLITGATGRIYVQGRGGDAVTAGSPLLLAYGVYVQAGAAIAAGGSGRVDVRGTAGVSTASGRSAGVFISNSNVASGVSEIRSTDGNIVVDGTAGGAPGSDENAGVQVNNFGRIFAGGGGSVRVTGTGTSTGGDGSSGVVVVNGNAASQASPTAAITSANSSVLITGTGADGAAAVAVLNEGKISSGGGFAATIFADSLTLGTDSGIGAGTITAGAEGSSTLQIVPRTPGTRIDLGGDDVRTGPTRTLGLSVAEIGQLNATDLFVGDQTRAGPVIVSQPLAPTSVKALTILTDAGLTLAADVTTTAGQYYEADITLDRDVRLASETRTLDLTEIGDYATTGLARGVATSADGGIVYVADAAGGLLILDVSDPAAPTLLGSVDTLGAAQDVALSADGTTAYVTTGVSGLRVVDVSDPRNPTLGGSVATGTAANVAVVPGGQYVAVTSSSGGLFLVDVLDADNPAVAGSYTGTLAGSAGVAVSADGLQAYVCDFNDGLAVIDISNPATPVPTGMLTLGIAGVAADVAISPFGNLVYVTDTRGQLWIVDVTGASPDDITTFAPAGAGGYLGLDVSADGETVFVATFETGGVGANGLVAVNVSDPTAPAILDTLSLAAPAFTLALAPGGAVAYVADGSGGLRVVDCFTETPSGGSLTFTGTVDGPVSGTGSLTVATTNTIDFQAALGGVRALAGLATTGATTLAADLTVAGPTAFGSDVVLAGDVTLTARSTAPDPVTSEVLPASVTFGSAIRGAHALTIDDGETAPLPGLGEVRFSGPVGSVATPLTSLTITAPQASVDSAGMTLHAGTIALEGSDLLLGPLAAGAGGVALEAGSFAAIAGDVTSGGAFTTTGPARTTFMLTALGDRSLNAAGINFGGPVTVGGSNNATLSVTSAGQPITFTGALSACGSTSLALDAGGGGDILFSAPVTTLAGLTVTNARNVTAAAAIEQVGTVVQEAGAGTTTLAGVSTTGPQSYATTAVRLGGGTYATGGGPLTIAAATAITGDVTVATGTGAIAFNGTLDGGHALVLDSTSTTTFAAVVGGGTPLGSIATNAEGTTRIAGAVTTTGAQAFGDQIVLTGDVTLVGSTITLGRGASDLGQAHGLTITGDAVIGGDVTATGGPLGISGTTTLADSMAVRVDAGSENVTFSGAVDGRSVLEIIATGTTTFLGTVGGTRPLVSLQVTGDGGTVDARGVTINSGEVDIESGEILLGPLVVDGGGVNLDASISALLTGGIASLGALTTGGGLTTFALPAGAGLDVAAAGMTFGGPVMVAGFQQSLALRTSGNPLTFNGVLNACGSASLALDAGGAGDILFGGPVQGLAGLTVTNARTVRLFGNVTTTGGQAYGEAVVALEADAVLTGATGSFGTVVGNGRNLTLNFGGVTTVDGAVITGVRDLTTGGGGVTRLRNTLTTSGPQVYDDAVEISGAVTLDTAAANGAVTLAGGTAGIYAVTGSGGSLVVRTGAGGIDLGGAAGFGTGAGAGELVGDVSLAGGAIRLLATENAVAGTFAVPSGTITGSAATGSLALAAGSRRAVNVTGTAAGSGYDQFIVGATGDAAIDGAALTVTASTAVDVGTVLTLVDNRGSAAVIGRFADLPEGAFVTTGANVFTISYVGGDGNDVTLTATVADVTVTVIDDVVTIALAPDGVTITNLSTQFNRRAGTLVITLTGAGVIEGSGAGVTIPAGSEAVRVNLAELPGFAGLAVRGGAGTDQITVGRKGIDLAAVRRGGPNQSLTIDTGDGDADVLTAAGAISTKGAGGLALATSGTGAAAGIQLAGQLRSPEGPVAIAGPTMLRTDTKVIAGGAVTFSGTIDGARRLTISTAGAVTLAADVGGATPLAGVTLARASATSIEAGFALDGTRAGRGASGLTIGRRVNDVVFAALGTASAPARTIQGFAGSGVLFQGGSTGSVLTGLSLVGNGVGISAAAGDYAGSVIRGTSIEASRRIGIDLRSARGLLVGGAEPGAGNHIAASTAARASSTGIRATGTLTGTRLEGNAIRDNAGSGVVLAAARGISVGGAVVGAGNTITGNGGFGLVASGACSGSVVEGNLLDGNTRGPLNVRRARGLTVVREADAP